MASASKSASLETVALHADPGRREALSDFRVVVATFHRYHRGIVRVIDSLDREAQLTDDERLPSLDTLREILFGRQVARLEGELDDLERRLTDRDRRIAIIAPVLGDAIRRQIRDARQEMIEALYPIIGQLVMRAVSEAIRDLARTIDARVRTSFDPRVVGWRLRARVSGVSGAEMTRARVASL